MVFFITLFISLEVCKVHALAAAIETLGTVAYCLVSARFRACVSIVHWLSFVNPQSSACLSISARWLYSYMSAARCAGVRALRPPGAASAVASGQPGRTLSRIKHIATSVTPKKTCISTFCAVTQSAPSTRERYPVDSSASTPLPMGLLERCTVDAMTRSVSIAGGHHTALDTANVGGAPAPLPNTAAVGGTVDPRGGRAASADRRVAPPAASYPVGSRTVRGGRADEPTAQFRLRPSSAAAPERIGFPCAVPLDSPPPSSVAFALLPSSWCASRRVIEEFVLFLPSCVSLRILCWAFRRGYTTSALTAGSTTTLSTCSRLFTPFPRSSTPGKWGWPEWLWRDTRSPRSYAPDSNHREHAGRQ